MMKVWKLFMVFPVLLAALIFVSTVSADYTYIVQPGDTLFRIAVNHGLTLGELAEANGIVNPSVIYAGQILTIPEEGEPLVEAAAVPIYHLIEPGDTLFKIAVRYGLSMQTVAQANNINNYDIVIAGQTMLISAQGDGIEPSAETSGSAAAYSGSGKGERWVDVNLSTQMLTAFEGSQAVLSTYISSGLWPYVTVTGEFEVYLRYQAQDMDGFRLGYDYYLEDVPYVMYFYEDYALHGTFWHNNFGSPMSHGCVNMTIPDAQWLFNWGSYGMTVNIHY